MKLERIVCSPCGRVTHTVDPDALVELEGWSRGRGELQSMGHALHRARVVESAPVQWACRSCTSAVRRREAERQQQRRR